MEAKNKLMVIMVDIKAEQKRFTEVKDSQKQENYDSLLKSYNESVEKLLSFITELQNTDNRVPTKNELESIEMMLDIINKIDYTTLDKLNRFGGRAKS